MIDSSPSINLPSSSITVWFDDTVAPTTPPVDITPHMHDGDCQVSIEFGTDKYGCPLHESIDRVVQRHQPLLCSSLRATLLSLCPELGSGLASFTDKELDKLAYHIHNIRTMEDIKWKIGVVAAAPSPARVRNTSGGGGGVSRSMSIRQKGRNKLAKVDGKMEMMRERILVLKRKMEEKSQGGGK